MATEKVLLDLSSGGNGHREMYDEAVEESDIMNASIPYGHTDYII